jgi:hypothetical protein
MIAKSQRDTGRNILKSKKLFPVFNPLDYDASLRKNLAFYNIEIDNDFKKLAAIEYYKALGKDVTKISKLKEGWFQTIGAVAHMHMERDVNLETRHLNYLAKKYDELSLYHEEEVEQVVKSIAIPREDRDARELSTHIAEFEAGIDLIYAGKTFDTKGYLLSKSVKPAHIKLIAKHFKPVLKELKDIDTDEQVKEAYDSYSKRDLRLLKERVAELITTCETISAVTKAKSPRIQKDKPPSVQAKDVKYKKIDEDLGIKSITPDKIVNSGECWVFNTAIRRLYRYTALDGMKLRIKGTTILNFDPAKSGGKIIRKPETQLKEIEAMTSKPLNKLFDGIRAVASKATGRLNLETIILKTY